MESINKVSRTTRAVGESGPIQTYKKTIFYTNMV